MSDLRKRAVTIANADGTAPDVSELIYDLLDSTIGAQEVQERAADAIRKRGHGEIEVLAAAMELPQIKALLVALEELRLEAWGYDHLFETPFHAHVHDTLQYELKKLVKT